MARLKYEEGIARGLVQVWNPANNRFDWAQPSSGGSRRNKDEWYERGYSFEVGDVVRYRTYTGKTRYGTVMRINAYICWILVYVDEYMCERWISCENAERL